MRKDRTVELALGDAAQPNGLYSSVDSYHTVSVEVSGASGLQPSSYPVSGAGLQNEISA